MHSSLHRGSQVDHLQIGTPHLDEREGLIKKSRSFHTETSPKKAKWNRELNILAKNTTNVSKLSLNYCLENKLLEAGVPKKWRDTERGEEIGKAREGERGEKWKRVSKILSSFCNLILLSGALITVSVQTWDLSKNLHDHIFQPKILHTKSA